MGDLPHDARLYTSQLLLVLASSPLAWTGAAGFRLVGYSLGGAVVVPFANAFPHMVSSLVLLAPAGLIDAAAFGAVSRFVFSSGLVPERILAVLTGRRLQRPLASSVAARARAAVALAAAEAKAEAAPGTDTDTDTRTDTDTDTGSGSAGPPPLEARVSDYVRWMVRHHDGFVPAFMSCVRHAPLTGQHRQWRGLATRPPGTTAVILARADELIRADEYAHGLELAGGAGRVFWRVVPGGHDFVMTHVDDVMRQLDEFWGPGRRAGAAVNAPGRVHL